MPDRYRLGRKLRTTIYEIPRSLTDSKQPCAWVPGNLRPGYRCRQQHHKGSIE